VYFQPIEPIYNSKQTFVELKRSALWIQEKDRERALAVINELISMKKAGALIVNEISNLEELKDYFKLSAQTNVSKQQTCEIDLSNLFLTPNGGISFCGSFPDIGNIQKTSIKNALVSPFARMLRKRIRHCGKIDICKSTCKVNKSLYQQARLFLMLNK
jgi:radical SAM protein with 4Fe4S-binding SPASM domain